MMAEHGDALGDLGLLVTVLLHDAAEVVCVRIYEMVVFAVGLRHHVSLAWGRK